MTLIATWVFLFTTTSGSLSLGQLPAPASLVSVPLLSGTTSNRVAVTSVSWSHQLPVCEAWTRTPALPLQEQIRRLGSESLNPSTSALSLSPASEPFPRKLVDKIVAGDFVEMRDLLTDNISLLQQMEVMGAQQLVPSLPGFLKPRLREVSTLPSWLFCYLAYVALRAPDPATRDRLAYARLLIREAQRHGGSGWIDYDRVFRQQAALDPSLRWNTLHPGIQAATLLGQTPGGGAFCTLCREADHTADGCALAYLHHTPGPALPVPSVGGPSPRQQPARRRPESLQGICVSWNKGKCIFPRCTYRHVCATCQQRHMARDCSKTPEDSEYKKDTQRPPNAPPRSKS